MYNKSKEGSEHINIDVTSSIKIGRQLSVLTEHEPIESTLGFQYSCLKAVDKYLKLSKVDSGLFKSLVSSDKHDAIVMYEAYSRITGRTLPTEHHKCIIMFLMWERAMIDREYFDNLIKLQPLTKKLRVVSYNAHTGMPTLYDSWLPYILVELCNSVFYERMPLIKRFSNSKSATLWHTDIPTYDGNIITDVIELHNKCTFWEVKDG